jgi:putative ABC transport system ATP-binding protein
MQFSVAKVPGLEAIRSLSKDDASPRSRLLRFAALERDDIGSLVVYAVAIGLVSLAVPIAAQSLVNSLAFTALLQPIVVLSVLVLIGLALAGVLRALQHRVVEALQQRFMVRTTHDIIERLRRVDIEEFRERSPIELVNRFFDAALVQKAGSTLLTDGMSAILQAAVSLVLLAFYHPALLAFDVVLIGLIGVILVGLGRKGTPTSIKESKAKYEIAAWLGEVAGALRTFKGKRAGEFAYNKADELAAQYVHAREKHFTVVFRQTVSAYALQALATATLLGLGGFLIVEGQLSLGQLVAAELIVTGVLLSVSKFGKYLESYYDLTASFDKLGAIADLKSERTSDATRKRSDLPATLSVSEVEFSYDGKGSALDPVSFEVPAGAQVAVLANEASGKSTLVDILYGLRTPTHGKVLLDGVDIRSLAPDDLRCDVERLGKPEVFAGTILENLKLGQGTIDAHEVAEALLEAGLSEEISALPDGIATRVGNGGRRLTSSQAARVTIARGVLAHPRLLIIDGTLDALPEQTAQDVLERIMATRTTLVVMTSRADIAAHLPRTVTLSRSSRHLEVR